MVKKFIQGQGQDEELFGLLGQWLTSKAIQQQLGMAVTSAPDDVWHIAINNKKATGFALTHFQKNKTAHIRFLFTEDELLKSKEAILKEVLETIKNSKEIEIEIETIFTNDRQDAPWITNGFKKQPTIKGKSFCRYEKKMEAKNDKPCL